MWMTHGCITSDFFLTTRLEMQMLQMQMDRLGHKVSPVCKVRWYWN